MLITTPLCTEDYLMFKGIIEQGIDSHLEAFTSSKFEEKLIKGQPRLVMNFGEKDLPILVRRLEELWDNHGNEEAYMWACDITGMNEEDA
jgi:hypothetical protein